MLAAGEGDSASCEPTSRPSSSSTSPTVSAYVLTSWAWPSMSTVTDLFIAIAAAPPPISETRIDAIVALRTDFFHRLTPVARAGGSSASVIGSARTRPPDSSSGMIGRTVVSALISRMSSSTSTFACAIRSSACGPSAVRTSFGVMASEAEYPSRLPEPLPNSS